MRSVGSLGNKITKIDVHPTTLTGSLPPLCPLELNCEAACALVWSCGSHAVQHIIGKRQFTSLASCLQENPE